MRKVLAFIVMATAMLFANAQNIPSEARHFINTYFPNRAIQGVAEYAATSPIAFTVELDNNIHIDFDANGAWLAIQAYEAGLPVAVIPTKIAQFLTEKGYNSLTTFATIDKQNGQITIINQDGAGYVFDASGRFLRETSN